MHKFWVRIDSRIQKKRYCYEKVRQKTNRLGFSSDRRRLVQQISSNSFKSLIGFLYLGKIQSHRKPFFIYIWLRGLPTLRTFPSVYRQITQRKRTLDHFCLLLRKYFGRPVIYYPRIAATRCQPLLQQLSYLF